MRGTGGNERDVSRCVSNGTNPSQKYPLSSSYTASGALGLTGSLLRALRLYSDIGFARPTMSMLACDGREQENRRLLAVRAEEVTQRFREGTPLSQWGFMLEVRWADLQARMGVTNRSPANTASVPSLPVGNLASSSDWRAD